MKYLKSFIFSSIFVYISAAIIGSAMKPTYDTLLTESQAIESLEFVFSSELQGKVDITYATGSIHHGALTRTAFIAGGNSSNGTSSNGKNTYSEQVLKVGWPFTVARGFVHSTSDSQHTHGAILFDKNSDQQYRLLPFQPVWPGVIFWGVIGTLLTVIWNLRINKLRSK